MDILFSSSKMAKICNSNKEMVKVFGVENAKKLQQRLIELRAAENLSHIKHIPPQRLHELSNNRVGQFAVDVKQPYRLIFKPAHDPVPKTQDGGIDKSQVTAVIILEVEDYHGK